MDLPALRWLKSSRSQSQSNCVEVATTGTDGLVRDSKNPTGPILRADLPQMLAAIKAGHLDC